MNRKLLVVAGVIAAAAAVACGSADSTSAFSGNPDDNTGGGDSSGPEGGTNPQTGGLTEGGAPLASAGSVVLVHASRNLPAFRVCFEGVTNTLPLPDDKIMPNANVVGVDVGTAVHIGELNDFKGISSSDASVPVYDAGEAGPASPVFGTVHVIEERLTRQFYPQGTDPTAWPDCGNIVTLLRQNGYEGHGLYTLNGDTVTPNSSLANFVVVKGCLPDPTLSTKECGTGFTTTGGNLSYQLLTVVAQDGMGFDFEGVSASPAVPNGTSLYYNPVNPPQSSALPIRSDIVSTGESSTLPSADSDYGKASFELRDGTNKLIFQQTLADIQARSAPRDLPASFFGLRSTFVLFAIGDPTVTDKTAPTALHFLAVPVQDPDMIDPEGGAL